MTNTNDQTNDRRIIEITACCVCPYAKPRSEKPVEGQDVPYRCTKADRGLGTFAEMLKAGIPDYCPLTKKAEWIDYVARQHLPADVCEAAEKWWSRMAQEAERKANKRAVNPQYCQTKKKFDASKDYQLLSTVVNGLTLDELDDIGDIVKTPNGGWWPVVSDDGIITSVRDLDNYDYQDGTLLNRGSPVDWDGEIVDGSAAFVRSRCDEDGEDEDVGVDKDEEYRRRGREYRVARPLGESLFERVARIEGNVNP